MKKLLKLYFFCGFVVNFLLELEIVKFLLLCIIYFIELEVKKSKIGIKKNEKEVVGEGLVLYEDFLD